MALVGEVVHQTGAGIVLIVWVAFALLLAGGAGAALGSRLHRHRPRPDPLDTLKDRLARGEIDVEEYQRRRHAILEAEVPGPI